MLFVIIVLLFLSIIFYLLYLKRKNDEVWIDIFKNIENIKYIGRKGDYNIFELKTIRYNLNILYHQSYIMPPDLKVLNKDTGKFLKISKNSWNITPYLK